MWEIWFMGPNIRWASDYCNNYFLDIFHEALRLYNSTKKNWSRNGNFQKHKEYLFLIDWSPGSHSNCCQNSVTYASVFMLLLSRGMLWSLSIFLLFFFLSLFLSFFTSWLCPTVALGPDTFYPDTSCPDKLCPDAFSSIHLLFWTVLYMEQCMDLHGSPFLNVCYPYCIEVGPMQGKKLREMLLYLYGKNRVQNHHQLSPDTFYLLLTKNVRKFSHIRHKSVRQPFLKIFVCTGFEPRTSRSYSIT